MDRIDYLTNLPVDLFFQQLIYLHFDDVIKVCTLNSKFHFYGTNYKNKWKQIIDNTFSSVYNYQNKLSIIWSKLNIDKNSYNYLVYTQLINLLDPLTQLMIYYKQDDTKSFNSKKFTHELKFLAMFLLNKPDEMEKYKHFNPYVLLLTEEIIPIDFLNKILTDMARYGNIKGLKYLISKGADIHANENSALIEACCIGHIDVVKYLTEQGADIHANNDEALISAVVFGRLDIVKYLVEQGTDIHVRNDALISASQEGHLDVVKYLVEQGVDIHVRDDKALIRATTSGCLNIVKYLLEQGVDIYIRGCVLREAIRSGQSEIIKYLKVYRKVK